jgi:hypothetical protein
LETIKGLDFPIEGCNDFISTDVTIMDMQWSQSPCFVPLVVDEIKELVNPNKKARLEKVVKQVAFNLPIRTENDKEQCGVQVH